MDPHVYETYVEWEEDRKGMLSAKGVNEKFHVVTPPPFPKGVEGYWSPEHLFAAAVSSCLMTTFMAIAENSRLEIAGFNCKASSKLGKVDGKFQVTEVVLHPTVTILNEKDREKTERILQKSDHVCLISNSFCGSVIMDKPDIRVVRAENV